jgi:hypothetical protein
LNPGVFPEGQAEIPLNVFIDAELSCDWERYQQDPFSSFHVLEGKTCVIKITVCDDI